MIKNEVYTGLRVIIGSLGPLPVNTSPQYGGNRREGAKGTIRYVIPSSRGLVWWVHHDTGEHAPYSIHEFEPLPKGDDR